MNSPSPILVTGASGFIGGALTAALRASGVPVRALVRTASQAAAIAATGAEPIVGDLLDPLTAHRATAGVSGVYHLAGQLFAPGTAPESYERLHVGATAALLDGSAAAGTVRFFVLCSTTGVHGPTHGRLVREDDPAAPSNAYEHTKAAAETMAREHVRRSGVPLVIARPGLVYGPGDLHLAGWFRTILRGQYRVIGTGTNRFHPIYVTDVVCGLTRCATRASMDGRAYHLVGARPVTMHELSTAIADAVERPLPSTRLPVPAALAAATILEAMPLPRRMLPLTRSRVRFMTQDRAYDGTRARDELGFVPRVDLPEGLSRTVAWYREQGLL